MYKGIYEFAGLPVEIHSIYDYIHKMCKNYETTKSPLFLINIEESDIEYERKRESEDSTPVDTYPSYYLETLAVYRKFLQNAYQYNVFLFHSSSFMIDGKAFILTATSGTGKSTHAIFLKEVYQERFCVINDDKPLIKKENNQYIVYGSPWNGKHGLDNNIGAPLCGIFVLYQAKENEINKMNQSDTLTNIYKQVYKPFSKEGTQTILTLSIDMSVHIPCFHLGCTNSIDAAKFSSKTINELLK